MHFNHKPQQFPTDTRVGPFQQTPVCPYRWDNLHSSQLLSAVNLLTGEEETAFHPSPHHPSAHFSPSDCTQCCSSPTNCKLSTNYFLFTHLVPGLLNAIQNPSPRHISLDIYAAPTSRKSERRNTQIYQVKSWTVAHIRAGNWFHGNTSPAPIHQILITVQFFFICLGLWPIKKQATCNGVTHYILQGAFNNPPAAEKI